jgi:hypothetical protein
MKAAYAVGNAIDLPNELRVAEGSMMLERRLGFPGNTSVAG